VIAGGSSGNPEKSIQDLSSLSQNKVSDNSMQQQASSITIGYIKESANLDSGENLSGNENDGSSERNLNGQAHLLAVQQNKSVLATTNSAPDSSEVSEPLTGKSMEHVVQQVKEHLSARDYKTGTEQVCIRLTPENMGELKLNLRMENQQLKVEIITENSMIRDALLKHSDTLKESLARQNITMETFDVTTGGKGSGNQTQNQNAWRELAKQQQQQQLWTSPRGYHTAQADLPSGQAAFHRQQGHSMLDIHY
jgi:flagellar hook-length control protein FliK